jgi:hypothetical protein
MAKRETALVLFDSGHCHGVRKVESDRIQTLDRTFSIYNGFSLYAASIEVDIPVEFIVDDIEIVLFSRLFQIP